MLNLKNITVGSATIEQDEALTTIDVLTQGIVGHSRFFATLRQISTYRNVDWYRIVGKHHAGSVQAFMWMSGAEIANRWFVVFTKNAGNYVNQQAFRWRLPTVDYLSRDGDIGAIQRKG